MIKKTTSHSYEGKSLEEWLSYIESIHCQEIELGLKRIDIVAKRLGVDLGFAKVVTVAGTNGKGTTCAFLENALLANNLNVAVYSSPHIETFNERLRLNKIDVSDNRLIDAFVLIEQARDDISLSYYEFTTLAAFIVLMQTKPDIIILEVGLGGRLDATNLIDANIAVLTTIDLDHQAFLGNTRELIGFEKAGIMREKQCIVVGDNHPPASVINKAKSLNPLLNDYIQNVRLKNSQFFSSPLTKNKTHDHANWQWQYKKDEHTPVVELSGLIEPHIPLDNVATALMVLWELSDAFKLTLSREAVNLYIDNTRVAGRTELFSRTIKNIDTSQYQLQCDVMLDVAHNPQAAKYLAGKMGDLLSQNKYKRINAVVGMLIDKDISKTLSEMAEVIDNWYIAPANAPRAADIKTLQSKLPTEIKSFNCFDNIPQAFKIANTESRCDELLLVFGSFFTVAEVRKLLMSHKEQ
jgi:dihydrofolate synthase/folylpolyglutamate synthase